MHESENENTLLLNISHFDVVWKDLYSHGLIETTHHYWAMILQHFRFRKCRTSSVKKVMSQKIVRTEAMCQKLLQIDVPLNHMQPADPWVPMANAFGRRWLTLSKSVVGKVLRCKDHPHNSATHGLSVKWSIHKRCYSCGQQFIWV